jgi:hypothetical protein
MRFQCLDAGSEFRRFHGAPLRFQYGRDSLPFVGRERAVCDALRDDRLCFGVEL